MNQKVQTLKGFRDFLPQEAKKRQYVINTLKSVFELYGFEPLETPALEYEEILMGKYGEEGDKLMYRFTDLGGRKVALRYDQTVPLARVIAQYGSLLSLPFKRYQIQPVWRAENTQKGRFREFLQCDADIVGVNTPLSDAEVILVAAKALEKLGFKDYKILINDRNVFSLMVERGTIEEKDIISIVRSIDKLNKIGREGVLNELTKKGFGAERATYIIQEIESLKPTDKLQQIFLYLEEFNLSSSQYKFSPTLARGLDYYTGLIFEIEIKGYPAGSVCGGGRYDKLIGMFTNQDIPAVGFAFGFDRLIEAIDELKLFPQDLTITQVLVTVFSSEFMPESINVCSRLRSNSINCEIYLNENAPLEKQLKYADRKKIPWVVIIGPQEKEKGILKIKNLLDGIQKEVSIEEFISLLK